MSASGVVLWLPPIPGPDGRRRHQKLDKIPDDREKLRARVNTERARLEDLEASTEAKLEALNAE